VDALQGGEECGAAAQQLLVVQKTHMLLLLLLLLLKWQRVTGSGVRLLICWWKV
jgi:hypothetical protein